MALLDVQIPSRDGIDPAYVPASSGGDSFPSPSGLEMVSVKNGDTSPHDVILKLTKTIDGQSATNRTVTVPAGGERMIGPFPVGDYRNDSGNVEIDYSAITSITVAVFRISF